MRLSNLLLTASVLNHTCALQLNVDDSSSPAYTKDTNCWLDKLPDEDDNCFLRSQKWDGPVSK